VSFITDVLHDRDVKDWQVYQVPGKQIHFVGEHFLNNSSKHNQLFLLC